MLPGVIHILSHWPAGLGDCVYHASNRSPWKVTSLPSVPFILIVPPVDCEKGFPIIIPEFL